jgi:hypothetical protein
MDRYHFIASSKSGVLLELVKGMMTTLVTIILTLFRLYRLQDLSG